MARSHAPFSPPQTKYMHVRLIGESQLDVPVNVSMNGFLSLCYVAV